MNALHDFDPDPLTPTVCGHCGFPAPNWRHNQPLPGLNFEPDPTGESRRARDAELARINDSANLYERVVIDEAIVMLAGELDEFSANDLRGRLPDVRPALLGARVAAAAKKGTIIATGRYVMSSDPRTRHVIAVWASARARAQRSA